MALTQHLITTGESLIHRFRLTNNDKDIVDQVFNISSRSAGGSGENVVAFNNPSLNIVGVSQQTLSLPALSPASKWTILDARNIIEINTGKNIVCALFSSCKQKQVSFLIVTSYHDKLVLLKYVKVSKSYQMPSFDNSNKPRLIDGPGIIWVNNSHLHVASCLFGAVCRLSLKSHPLSDEPGDKLSLFQEGKESKQTSPSLVFYHHFRGLSLVVGRRINVATGKETSFATEFPIPVDSFKNVDISQILPEPYFATVQHVHVLACTISKPEDEVHSDNSSLLNIHLLAVVCDGYLIEFHAGKLTRCFHLFPNIRIGISQLSAIPSRETSSSGPASSSWFPVIVTNEHKVYIITAQLTKVHSILDGFSHAFIDDFLQNGNSQLLLAQLLPTNEDPNLFTNCWLLTDLDSCHFESQPKIHSNEDSDCHIISPIGTVAECPAAIEKALNHKIQMDILRLEEKWRLLKIRNDFINQCWWRFVDLQTFSLPNEKKSGLMSFIEGPTQRVACAKQTYDSHPVKILQMWQKIYGDHWIVGVDFRYSKPKLLKKASLLITSSSGNLTSSSTATTDDSIVNSSEYFTLCGKSFFGKNNDLSVTCVVHPFPHLTVHPTRKFLVLLSLHTVHEELKKLHVIMHPCGTIDFGMQQMIGAGSSLLQTEPSLPFNELSRTACLLNAVQSRWKVEIRSKKSRLNFLEKHWKSFEELSWNPLLKCFLFRSDCRPLMDARLTIDKQQPHRCFISIFVREVSCIPAIIHFLYSRLPDDVLILPDMSLGATKVVRWLQQLQSYLQNLSKEFSSLDDQRTFRDDCELVTSKLEPLSADLLDQMRHECEAKKRKLTDRHIIDVGKCQPLITFLEKEKFVLDSLAVIFS